MPRLNRWTVLRGAPMAAALGLALVPASAVASGPAPGSLPFIQRDLQNMRDAYGRETAPDGQFNNPAFAQALVPESTENGLRQAAEQAAAAGRLAISPGNLFPGWNTGNPLRRGWAGRRGVMVPVSYTNRYGALIRGDLFAPLPGARDPYTGARLKPPYPGVVITTGSVQGSERMYFWLAEDLAERGYVVLTYDVQGQGRSETLPHQGPVDAVPFCNPFAPPSAGEMFACPGVPFQQESNFVFGTLDALGFFTSTPAHPYRSPASSDQPVNRFNPLWKLFDRRPDRRSVTRGRTTRIAIIGHSLGAAAVSYVQGIDPRVETVVALDKLFGAPNNVQTFGPVRPVVPALGVQSEYGFSVNPYFANNGSSLTPSPGLPTQGPDPRREQATGFDIWRRAGVDTMLVVPRASTHLEYTDIAYALPASRYGQDFTSYYVQAWLARYLKHQGTPVPPPPRRRHGHKPRRAHRTAAAGHPAPDPLLATAIRYLEPVAVGRWAPVVLHRSAQLSFYYCSGWAFHDPVTRRLQVNLDPGGVGGCR